MFISMCLGAVLIFINVILHSFALDFIIQEFEKWDDVLERVLKRRWIPFISALVIFGVLLSNSIQIWIWALVYHFLPHMPFTSMETDLYLSATTMTTLGMGDVTIPAPWNLLCASESMNGFVVFGWSTAFIFEVIAQLYRREAGLMANEGLIEHKKKRYEERHRGKRNH